MIDLPKWLTIPAERVLDLPLWFKMAAGVVAAALAGAAIL